jgi:hypothetical protein
MTFAVLVKVLRSPGHFRAMPVGKVGNEGSYRPTELSMLMAVRAGGLSPVLVEDLAEQVQQQATNALH